MPRPSARSVRGTVRSSTRCPAEAHTGEATRPPPGGGLAPVEAGGWVRGNSFGSCTTATRGRSTPRWVRAASISSGSSRTSTSTKPWSSSPVVNRRGVDVPTASSVSGLVEHPPRHVGAAGRVGVRDPARSSTDAQEKKMRFSRSVTPPVTRRPGPMDASSSTNSVGPRIEGKLSWHCSWTHTRSRAGCRRTTSPRRTRRTSRPRLPRGAATSATGWTRRRVRSSASSRRPTPRPPPTVHREAHGLVADEIYAVTEGA